MHIAASPQQFPDEHQVDGAAGLQPLPCLPRTVSSGRQDSAVLVLPSLPTGTEAFILGVLVITVFFVSKSLPSYSDLIRIFFNKCVCGVCLFMGKLILNTLKEQT